MDSLGHLPGTQLHADIKQLLILTFLDNDSIVFDVLIIVNIV